MDLYKLAESCGSVSDNNCDDKTTYEFDKKALRMYTQLAIKSEVDNERNLVMAILNGVKSQDNINESQHNVIHGLIDALTEIYSTESVTNILE